MKILKLFVALLATALLSGCDSSAPPEAYRGAHEVTAIVQVFPSPGLPNSEHFLANQIVILKTGSIINTAADACGVEPNTISSALEITEVQGTELLAVTAHHDEESRSKAIVQALLDSYRKHRQALKDTAIVALEETVVDQKKLVTEKQKERDKNIVAYGIPQFDSDHPGPMGRTEEEMFQGASQKLADYEALKDQVKIEIKNLNESSNDDLIRYAAGLDLPENEVAHYFTQHREALEKIRSLRSLGLADDHPDVIQAKTLAKTTLANAAQEAVALKEVLKTKLSLIERQIEGMKDLLSGEHREAEEKLAQKRSGQLARYLKAKQAFEEAENLLRRVKEELQEAHIASGKPQEFFIIHGWDYQ